MCIGNCAEISSRYINCQLRVLYEYASCCIEKRRNDDKPVCRELEYAIPLAQFTTSDKSAYFEFDYPSIEFICNHEIKLSLNIKGGNYRPSYKSGAPTKETPVGKRKVEFRIPFRQCTTEESRCPDIGDRTNHRVNLHILDTTSASLILPRCTGSDNERDDLAALSDCLTQFYLPALKEAGLDVLYSLPGFAKTGGTSLINYSVGGTAEPTTDTIFGVKVSDINKHFHDLWSKAEASVKNQKMVEEDNESSFMAKFRVSSEVDGKGGYFDLYFGPLQVQALCKSEIILYLEIRDICVYSEKKQETKYQGWRVAFIVDVIEESARSINIKIDAATISEVRSTTGNFYDARVTKVKKSLFSKLKKFFDKVKGLKYHIIPKKTDPTDTESGSGWGVPSPPKPPSPIGKGSVIGNGGEQGHILKKTRTTSFELTLTQASINKHFKSLWESALRHRSLSETTSSREGEEFQRRTCLARSPSSQQNKAFEAEFSAPEVQLVCDGKHCSAILYLRIKEGNLKLLDGEDNLKPRDISGWCAAFQMSLEVVDSRGDAVSSEVTNQPNTGEPISYKHIVLSSSSATFISEESDLHGADEYREALEYYIRKHYFPVFERAHHGVLFTTLQKKFGKGMGYRVFTPLQLRIAPFYTGSAPADGGLSHDDGLHGKICNSNAIIIMGVTQDVSPSKCSISQGSYCACDSGGCVPLETGYPSRSSFLERILDSLKSVNQKTTVVPYFYGIKDETWIFKLVTWDNHKAKRNKTCTLCQVPVLGNNTDNLRFEWKNENKEVWRYKSNFDEDVIYTFACNTTNELTIPTKHAEKCDIQINGTVNIKMIYTEGKANSVRDWSSEITVLWFATISLISTHSGLEVLLRPTQIVLSTRLGQVFMPGSRGYETHKEALEQLNKIFPSSIDLTTLVNELKTLEGVWDGVQGDAYVYYFSRPFFNRSGDLVLELVARGPDDLDGTGSSDSDVDPASTKRGTTAN